MDAFSLFNKGYTDERACGLTLPDSPLSACRAGS